MTTPRNISRIADPAEEFPLPVNLDAERFVLGAIMTDESAFLRVASVLTEDDFSIEKHKVIYRRMSALQERGDKIDRVTLANLLLSHGELQAVDGLSYLVSLDDGLPQIANIDAYVSIVKEKSTRRHIMRSAQKLVIQAATDSTSIRDIVSSAESTFLSLGDGGRNTNRPYNPGAIFDEYPGGFEAFIDQSRAEKGIQTGFIQVDEMTGGLREGEMIILAARPAMGKTAFALNIAQYVATNSAAPKAVAVFSLEMSKESLLQRMVCATARVDHQRYRSGLLNDSERYHLQNAAADIYNAPLFIDDTPGTNMMDIHSKVRRLKQEEDLGLVVIDYLQLMQGPKRENRVQEVSALSRGIKLMAKELKLPFLVLSQLSRAPEQRQGDHRPQLSDLRESGSIEQDADVVMFLFREEVYRPDKEDLKGLAELLMRKQRNGPTGMVKLAFLNRYTKFENLASAYDTGGADFAE